MQKYTPMMLYRHSDICCSVGNWKLWWMMICFCLQRFYKSCGCSNRFDKTHCNRFHTPEYTDTQRRNPVSMRRHYFITEPFYRYQYNTVQYNMIQYNMIQYNTVQYSTVQYSTVQYNMIQYSAIWFSTVQYSTVQYSTVPYRTVQQF